MDTHAMHTDLVKSGFTDQKAEAIVAAVKVSREEVVTRKDLGLSQAKQTTTLMIAAVSIAIVSIAAIGLIVNLIVTNA